MHRFVLFLLFTQIESRLSSRYSYDFHPETHHTNNMSNNYTPYNPNNYTPDNNFTSVNNYTADSNTSNHYCIPTFEPPTEDHYDFIDPWEEYLVEKKEQTNYEVESENVYVQNIFEYVGGDRNVVEVCLNNQCEQEVGNDYCINNFDTEEQTRDYSFQTNVVGECNTFGTEEQNNEHYEEVKEFNEPKQVQVQEPDWSINNEQNPVCSDDIPNNPLSSLSVNNCRPDSPAHCEVPKDQSCDIDVSII